MRLPLIDPTTLSAEQRPVYDNMRAGIEKNFQGFKAIAENGALLGPWNPWLHDPKFGKPIWDLTLALSVSPSLPRPAREVAILVTGTCIPLRLRTLRPRHRRRTSRPVGRQARDHPRGAAAGRSDTRGSHRLRRRFRPPPPRHLAGTDLSAGSGGIRAAWSSRIDLSGRTLLPGLGHAERLQCSGAAVRSRVA